MSDFDTRPMGTVMYGAFNAFAAAERALRVLKNAGYARAAFESRDLDEHANDEPTILVVDAAAAGATRAAEILEEFGAHIRFAVHMPARVAVETTAIVEHEAPAPAIAQIERKPRVRRRARPQSPANVPAPSEPPAWENVFIVTRSIESVATE